jgi:hypothetical protein
MGRSSVGRVNVVRVFLVKMMGRSSVGRVNVVRVLFGENDGKI